MAGQQRLADIESVMALSKRLSAKIEWIDREETLHDEPPSWTIAQSLQHIEGSLIDFQLHLDALLASEDEASTEDALHGLREDLRHILWHIENTPYFSVIVER